MSHMTLRDSLIGTALIAFAMLIFAMSDVIGKHLFAVYAVVAVAAVRYAINLVLLMVLLWPTHRGKMWATTKTGLVVARGLCLVLATLTMSYALKLMPVGETVALLYLYPLVVMLLAGPVLGERVRPFMWIGAALSFCGVLLIARPSGGLDPVGVVLMLINVCLATAYTLLTRHLVNTESTTAMLLHSALSGTIVFGALSALLLDHFSPTIMDGSLMVCMGVLATTGHFLITTAYRYAPASLLAPVNYLHLVFAGLLGFAVFGHVPDRYALFGMAMIVVSGAAVAILNHGRK
jgi:drug/metabolite transporter (DMT)-like permease